MLNPGNDFSTALRALRLDSDDARWNGALQRITLEQVDAALTRPIVPYDLTRMMVLLSPAADLRLEQMVQESSRVTRQRFGNTIQLYAPLYVSNHCVNACSYCGFDMRNRIGRTRLTIDEAVREGRALAATGIRNLLILAGEDPSYVTVDYLAELAGILRREFASISIEIHPLSRAEYKQLYEHGIDGVTCYQETYQRSTYARYHLAGPKADYDDRLSVHDRAGAAGMRRLGIGFLAGLADWRIEALALAEHVRYLMKRYWKTQILVSFPRLRPAEGVGVGAFADAPGNRSLAQLIAAFRLCFPDLGLVLSTRESAQLRDRFCAIGVTHMSAGSKTNPGAYSGVDADSLEQFSIEDKRSPGEVAAMLAGSGLDPVWKDWDEWFRRDTKGTH